ncbi:uncharacterized protein BT62DRAFT_578351 [Guyanagaster necrorhizus]|uniref:Uncharacterized protein n=1 Tax=Guyanagaster necrorhizus TaxID=856835 RepID=A0A9P8AN78_9AGAR|nr:uncharacterized protein BT62DRAFT_578351 [Guyanagaster necrorhizus MCA 3950]KAG7440617.1 hypothetical protein BT62DRAFT_578351 [Guyanagaster necrorhizus MCA 3950]
MDILEMTDNVIKALTPVSDENDPGVFESKPLPDDDVMTHVQTGDSQSLLTSHLNRTTSQVFSIDPPTDFIFSMANAAGEERSKQQLKYSQELLGSVFERVSEEIKDTFMSLRNRHLHDGSGPLMDMFTTNGYGLDNDLMSPVGRRL